MQRQKASFPIAPGQCKYLKNRVLNWANQYGILLFLDSNNYSSQYGNYECLVATGSTDIISGDYIDSLVTLQQLYDNHKDWLFGHICYDYKNMLENKLSSSHPTQLQFPGLHFFRPGIVCYISKDKMQFTIETLEGSAEDIYKDILRSPEVIRSELPALEFFQRINKDEYVQAISKLRQHIADGDCYEINFCNEGYAEAHRMDTLAVFSALNDLSPAPFAAYYKLDDKYAICASPERYLQKRGNVVRSQPMKGTAPRAVDTISDNQLIEQLKNDIKERAENVMIVDLVRNDLARSCKVGSVSVEELFGIYTFPQVHQMVSTVSGILKDNTPFTDAIRYSFPMGSMTGAPKIKVMQLIDQYERSRRELYSGTIGYIDPAGNFDFNVVIRSIFYNAASAYLSYHTGGAITYDSKPQQEWEEMRLKAWALEKIFK